MKHLLLIFSLCFLSTVSYAGNNNAPKLSSDKARKGYSIPCFTLPSRDGGEGSFGCVTQNQRHTLLIYAASGCGYSLMSMEPLSKIRNHYAEKVDMVTIWGDTNHEIWMDSYPEYKDHIQWTDLWDDGGEVAGYFKIKIFPTFILLDRDNKVAWIQKGVNFERLLNALKKNL